MPALGRLFEGHFGPIPEPDIGARCSIWDYGLEGDILRNAALFSSVDDRNAGQSYRLPQLRQ